MGAPLDLFLCILYGGSLRSVSLHTIWGPLRPVSLHTIYGGLLRSDFSLAIWGPPGQFLYLLYGFPLIFFILHVKLSLGGPIFFHFQGGKCYLLLPPPPTAGAHACVAYLCVHTIQSNGRVRVVAHLTYRTLRYNLTDLKVIGRCKKICYIGRKVSYVREIKTKV